MGRARLLLPQVMIGIAIALAVAAFGRRADAVAPDIQDWAVQWERAVHEIAAQRSGRVDSSHASPAINQRTLSKCAERGLLRPTPRG